MAFAQNKVNVLNSSRPCCPCRTRRGPLRCRAAVHNSQQAKESTKIGNSDVHVSSLGIGIWSWGDRWGYWGYGDTYDKADNEAAYDAILSTSVNFWDTAEIYGFGKSEELLGEFMQKTGTSDKAMVATKFATLPWRFTSHSVVQACKASLQRLQIPKLALYQIHFPASSVNFFANSSFLRGLAHCQQIGLTDAVGVSNFNEDRLRHAYQTLQDQGVRLASNQVQYSLLYREPERNGVMKACQELGVTLIAYSPLCQGLLTGKYDGNNNPKGPRGLLFTKNKARDVQPLIQLMREIGQKHDGKTPAQVAINWCLCKGTLPIPGAKTAKQAEEAAGALGWRLTPGECRALEATADRISRNDIAVGMPFEQW
ncbi:hypothetical protein ABBQ38_001718 [Trebouxia sp. C0009 RCD-2024]